MDVYLVRVAATRSIVGIYWAASYDSLYWLVDQCCDPQDCEVRQLRPWGGVFWPGLDAPAVPIDPDAISRDENYIDKVFAGLKDFDVCDTTLEDLLDSRTRWTALKLLAEVEKGGCDEPIQ